MKADELMRRVDLIKKTIEEEDKLSSEINDEALLALLDKDSGDIVITSDDLNIGDSKNIIFYEPVKDIVNKSLLEVLDDHLDKDKYSEFHIVIFVHSIKDKIHISYNLKDEIDRKIKEKRIRKNSVKVESYFVGQTSTKEINISIDSAIRINEFKCDDKKISGQVYTAKLRDLVELYNCLGDELFKENVRERIDDVLGVDAEIHKTLSIKPAVFWFLNNGITILADSKTVKQKKEYKLSVEINSGCNVSVINGAQTISTAAMYYYRLREEIESEKDDSVKGAKEQEEKMH